MRDDQERALTSSGPGDLAAGRGRGQSGEAGKRAVRRKHQKP